MFHPPEGEESSQFLHGYPILQRKKGRGLSLHEESKGGPCLNETKERKKVKEKKKGERQRERKRRGNNKAGEREEKEKKRERKREKKREEKKRREEEKKNLVLLFLLLHCRYRMTFSFFSTAPKKHKKDNETTNDDRVL